MHCAKTKVFGRLLIMVCLAVKGLNPGESMFVV